jgi:serine/threonine protein kinase
LSFASQEVFDDFVVSFASIAHAFLGEEASTKLIAVCGYLWLSGNHSAETLKEVLLDSFVVCGKLSQKQKLISLAKKRRMARELAMGLRYIHNQGIIHGDLKPGNLLWNDREAVIADFGGARRKSELDGSIRTTRGYELKSYLEQIERLHESGDQEGAFKVGCALDDRALALSLHVFMTGEF